MEFVIKSWSLPSLLHYKGLTGSAGEGNATFNPRAEGTERLIAKGSASCRVVSLSSLAVSRVLSQERESRIAGQRMGAPGAHSGNQGPSAACEAQLSFISLPRGHPSKAENVSVTLYLVREMPAWEQMECVTGVTFRELFQGKGAHSFQTWVQPVRLGPV